VLQRRLQTQWRRTGPSGAYQLGLRPPGSSLQSRAASAQHRQAQARRPARPGVDPERAWPRMVHVEMLGVCARQRQAHAVALARRGHAVSPALIRCYCTAGAQSAAASQRRLCKADRACPACEAMQSAGLNALQANARMHAGLAIAMQACSP